MRLGEVVSLVVVGSPGAGKTTLVAGLRTPAYRARVVVPRRFVTRAERLEDDPAENVHLDGRRFGSLLDARRLDPVWSRPLEGARTERYGFEAVDDADGRLRVLAANNAFLRDPNPSVLAVLETAIVVVVRASRQRRVARLSRKDMPAGERAVRLSDGGADLLVFPAETRVIDTTDLAPGDGQRALRTIVDELAERLRPAPAMP